MRHTHWCVICLSSCHLWRGHHFKNTSIRTTQLLTRPREYSSKVTFLTALVPFVFFSGLFMFVGVFLVVAAYCWCIQNNETKGNVRPMLTVASLKSVSFGLGKMRRQREDKEEFFQYTP